MIEIQGGSTMQDNKKNKGSKYKKVHFLPYTKENYYLFITGIIFIVLGYVALSKGPWNNFWSLTVAPILLVLGYCVIIPVALLYQKKKRNPQQDSTAQSVQSSSAQ